MQQLRPYAREVRAALDLALCIQSFPSQSVERHQVPECELQDNKELLLPPVVVQRERERCLIEVCAHADVQACTPWRGQSGAAVCCP